MQSFNEKTLSNQLVIVPSNQIRSRSCLIPIFKMEKFPCRRYSNSHFPVGRGKLHVGGSGWGVWNSLISKNLAHYSLSLKCLVIL